MLSPLFFWFFIHPLSNIPPPFSPLLRRDAFLVLLVFRFFVFFCWLPGPNSCRTQAVLYYYLFLRPVPPFLSLDTFHFLSGLSRAVLFSIVVRCQQTWAMLFARLSFPSTLLPLDAAFPLNFIKWVFVFIAPLPKCLPCSAFPSPGPPPFGNFPKGLTAGSYFFTPPFPDPFFLFFFHWPLTQVGGFCRFCWCF